MIQSCSNFKPQYRALELAYKAFSKMSLSPQNPKVGVAALIINKEGQILMGHRMGSHGAGMRIFESLDYVYMAE